MPRVNHGPGNNNYEKARDFKGAVKRLFSELNTFKTLIIVAFTLAILGSILSILAPNRLSDLTDEISAGLVINQDNMQSLTKEVTKNLNEKQLQKILPELLSPNMSEETIESIMQDNNISAENKRQFQEILTQFEDGNQTEAFSNLQKLPNNILEKIFTDSEYKGTTITTQDKIALIKAGKDLKQINLSKNMQNIFFQEITIDGTKITPQDQYKFIKNHQYFR